MRLFVRFLCGVSALTLMAGCGGEAGYSPDADAVTEPDSYYVVPDVPHEPEIVPDLGGDVADEPDIAPDAASDAGTDLTVPSPAASVDPFLGSGAEVANVGNAVPGATAPFGMVKLSPDTHDGIKPVTTPFHCAGYHYQDRFIEGFSHMHLHGTGIADYAFVSFMPGLPSEEEALRKAEHRIGKGTEQASPGRYEVELGNGVQAQLTASARAGFHRYTYPTGEQPILLIDLDHVAVNGHVSAAEVSIDAENQRVSGWLHNHGGFSGRYGGFPVYFDAEFDRPFVRADIWVGDTLQSDATEASGTPLRVILAFDAADGEVVQSRVGISLVGPEQARANRATELDTWDFGTVFAGTAGEWENLLGAVEVEGLTPRQREIFYSSLYHSMLMPTLLTDVDGSYVGLDKEIHTAEDFLYYTDFSLWDTFRTLHPLLTLIQPERARDFARSLLRMGQEGGVVPRWPQGTGYTGCMIASAGDCVLADTYIRGVTDFDVDAAWDVLMVSALGDPPPEASWGGRGGMEDYLAFGYLPADRHGSSVSRTLEYAFNDFCLAMLAQARGDGDAYETFAARAGNYRNLWDPETQFFRAKNADGSWLEPFNPVAWADAYTEASAWQYSWFVPHDVPGLAELFGSSADMAAKLEFFLSEGKELFNFLIPSSYYYQGNEPSIQAPYMFLEAGRPDLTQEWVRWILETNYELGPNGLIGNDDAGTIGAWYVLSALGIYPLPGTDVFYLGSPIVARAVLHLPGGDFEISAENNSAENLYVQSVSLDGAPLDEPWIHHGDIADGGSLVFVMGPTPSTWGVVNP